MTRTLQSIASIPFACARAVLRVVERAVTR